MKRTVLVFILLFSSFSTLISQVKITVVNLPSDTPESDTLFFASNINNWNPKDINYMFEKGSIDGTYSININESDKEILYKITRGSWASCESDKNGNSIENRILKTGTTTDSISVYGWHDHLYLEENTMSENVMVMTDSFYIPQLNRYRRIWVYTPIGYNSSNKSYPVIYMHDGQNLFNSKTSYFGEWEVDETMDKLGLESIKYRAIVVGIDNGGEYRIDELTPLSNKEYGGGNGKKYIEFITETLKPYIDKNYRTLSNRDNTYMIGSSLGGLISLYGVLSFREYFSGAGVLSPSLWFNNKIYYLPHYRNSQRVKMYILAGDSESETMVSNIYKLDEALHKAGYPENSYHLKIVEGGKHNEELWRNSFQEVVRWLLEN